MRQLLLAAAAAFALCACGPTTSSTGVEAPPAVTYAPSEAQLTVSPTAPYITAALSSTRRPAADHGQDEMRHPAETLALANIAPGQSVGEILPGGGYFTRLFSLAVGAHGHVYTIVRPHPSQYERPVAEDMGNVTTVRADYDAFTFPQPVDVVFTARNYHDLKIASYVMGDTVGMDRAAFAALRPGGVYVIIDHSATPGYVENQQHPLHRIDQDLVRREVESVGFVYDGELQILRNPQDPRTANIYDDAIRGHTDQFAMRFRKPG